MTLTTVLKKMLDGFAAADAGEFLTAKQKVNVLKGINNQEVSIEESAPVVNNTAVKPQARRKVAMYLGSELPSAMMEYVIDTCTNLQHDLTVLSYESGIVSQALLAPYIERLTELGINMETVRLSGEPIKGLAKYLRSHPEIAFLACKESGYIGRLHTNGNKQTNVLPVPVVVVVDANEASSAPEQQVEQVSKISAI